MKILYGIQGTGNGHISRVREMARAFSSLSVDVDFFFSGRKPEAYFDMACFGDYQTARGVSFVSEKGAIQLRKTIQNAGLKEAWKDIRQCDLKQYDLVLNDFEPITAWAAHRQKVPCLGLSHQAALLHDIPKQGESLLDQMLLRYFAPANYHIGLHWFHFEQPILPPIIPKVRSQDIAHKELILVYLPFESLTDILDLLSRFTQSTFYCYHPDVIRNKEYENIRLISPNRAQFQQDLHQCSGVIASAGFELPSEAMSCGKKMLLKPLAGQFEQQSNLATLMMMGMAHSMTSLDPTKIRSWLKSPNFGLVIFPDVAMETAQWILRGEWDNPYDLAEDLWKKVQFPEWVMETMIQNNLVPKSDCTFSFLSSLR